MDQLELLRSQLALCLAEIPFNKAVNRLDGLIADAISLKVDKVSGKIAEDVQRYIARVEMVRYFHDRASSEIEAIWQTIYFSYHTQLYEREQDLDLAREDKPSNINTGSCGDIESVQAAFKFWLNNLEIDSAINELVDLTFEWTYSCRIEDLEKAVLDSGWDAEYTARARYYPIYTMLELTGA